MSNDLGDDVDNSFDKNVWWRGLMTSCGNVWFRRLTTWMVMWKMTSMAAFGDDDW